MKDYIVKICRLLICKCFVCDKTDFVIVIDIQCALCCYQKITIAVSQLLESELWSRQQAGWKVNFGAGRLEKCVTENSMHSRQAVIYFLAFILNKESD